MVVVAAPLAWAEPAISHPTPDPGTSTTVTFNHAGVSRSYIRYVPTNLGSGAVPLVMALHGGLGSASKASEDTHPQSEWKGIAEAEKFVVVYPDGDKPGLIGRQWHDCRADAHSGIGTADDVGFLSAVVDDVDLAYNIDLTKVYSTGHSAGGLMSYRLAHELTHKIAAVGTSGANKPAVDECPDPDRPITVAMISGDADTDMPWGGGCLGGDCGTWGSVISAEATRDYWIAHNATGSTIDHTLAYPDDPTTTDASSITRYRYDGGIGGTQLAFFRVFGGAHAIPSTHHAHGNGEQNKDVDAAAELWAIMKTHTRSITYFDDGFETGNFTAEGWGTTGSPTVSTSAARTDQYGARLPGTTSATKSTITKAFSTVGYSSVRLEYTRRTSGLDSGEYLHVEWSTGGCGSATWTNVESTQSTSWAKQNVVLPPAAEGSSSFCLRFRNLANKSSETADIDNVVLVGA